MESGSDPWSHLMSVAQSTRRRGFGSTAGPADSFALSLQVADRTSSSNLDRRVRTNKLVGKWKSTFTTPVSGVTARGSEVEHTRPHHLEGASRASESCPMRPVQTDFKTDSVPCNSSALSRNLAQDVDGTDGVGTPIDPPELISPSRDPHWIKLLRATPKQDLAGADSERKVVAPDSSSAAEVVLRSDNVTSAPGHQKDAGSRIKGPGHRQLRPPPIVCLSPNTRRTELGLVFNSPASLGSGISSSYESSSGSELAASPAETSTVSSDISGSQPITLPSISSVGSSEYCISGTMSSATSFSDESNSHRDQQDFPVVAALAGNNRRHRIPHTTPVARARGFERPLPRPAVFSSPVGESREVYAVDFGAVKETRGTTPSSLPRPESVPINGKGLGDVSGTSTREGWRQRRQRGRSPPRISVSQAGSRLADFGRFIASAGATVSLRGTSRPLSPITVSRAVNGNLRSNQSNMRSPGSPFDPTKKQEGSSRGVAPTDASRSSYLGLHAQSEDPRIVMHKKEDQHYLSGYVTPEAGCITATGELPAPCADRSPPAGSAGTRDPYRAAIPSPIGIEGSWEKSPSWQFLAGRPEPAASPMSMSESCHSQSETDSLLEVPACIPHVALRPHDADLPVCSSQHKDAAAGVLEEVHVRDGGHVRDDRCSVRAEQEKIAGLIRGGAGSRTGMNGIEKEDVLATGGASDEVYLWCSGDGDDESQEAPDQGRRLNAERIHRRHRCRSRVSVGSSVSCSLLSDTSVCAAALVQDDEWSIADETVGTDDDEPGTTSVDLEGSSDRPVSSGGVFFKDRRTGFPRRSRKGSYRTRPTSVERGVRDIQHASGDLTAPSSGGGRQESNGCAAKVSIQMDVESMSGVEGSDDSDAESEYTPEEALEVLRKAAIRFSVASGHRDSAGSATVANCSDEGALVQLDNGVKVCGSAARDDRCTSQWSSRSGDSALDLLKLARDGDAANGPVADGECTRKTMAVGHKDEEQCGEKRASGVSEASEDSKQDNLHLNGEEDEEKLMEDPEVVLRMEKTFKKACRVLGIEMNRFFDTILESSVGDIDDLSATDAAAAVAAAAAGIRTPDDNVVVAPLVTPRIQQATTQSGTHPSERKTGGVVKASSGDEDHMGERSATRAEPRTSPNTPSPTRGASPKVADILGGAGAAGASADTCAVREDKKSREDGGMDAGAQRRQRVDAANNTRANAAGVVCVPSAYVEPRLLRRFATCKRKVVVESGEVARGADAKADLLLVKGDFEGTVEVRDLSVESGGILRGDIVAENVMVYGTIDGKLECRNMLVVRRGAKCSGKVFYHDMRVESGADVDADLHLLSRASVDSAEEPGHISPPSLPPFFAAENITNNAHGESKGVASADEGAGAVGAPAVLVPPTVRAPSQMETVPEGTSETSSTSDDTLRSPTARVGERSVSGEAAVVEAGSDSVAHERGSVAERGRCQRRTWATSKPASLSSTAVPGDSTLPCGTRAPSRLLRKHTMHSPERSQSPDGGNAGGAKRGEYLDGLESSTGLSAAVAAMEETQRAVEAARNADEEAEITNAQVVKEYHASVLSSSLDVQSGGDSWTIWTREITAVVPASPPPSNWMEPGISSESTALANRVKQTEKRATKGAANSMWSRRFTATETAMVVQEGKRALGAVRKDKSRERSKKSSPLLSPDAPPFPGLPGARPRGRAKARPAAPLLSPNAPPFPSKPEGELDISVGAGFMPPPMVIPLKSPEGMAPAPPVSTSTSARSRSLRLSRSASLSPDCSTSQSSLVTPTRPQRTSHKQPGSRADNRPPPKTHDGVPRSRRRRTEQDPPVVTPASSQLRKPRQWQWQRQRQRQRQREQQDQHEHEHEHQKQQPSTESTPPSSLGDRCSAFLVHLVKSSSPAKPAINVKPSSPESPGKCRRHPPAPNAGSGTPECTPPGDENGSRRDVTDGNNAEASGGVGRGSNPISQPLGVPPVPRGRKQRDHVEASPAGVPLVRQSRFRRSVSMEEPSRLRTSRAQAPLREGGASKETLGSESRPPFTQCGGLGVVGEALAARRRLRGWKKISSGIEIGSLWR